MTNKNNKQCSICGSYKTLKNKKVQSPFCNKKYTLYFCKDCKSYHFDKKEYKIELEELYNDKNRSWNTKFKYSIYWARQLKRIKKLLSDKNKKLNILDVGCRTGDFLLHWGKENANLYGVELNKYNSHIAKERGINVYNDFIENIEFDIKFDVITLYALLEHISSPKIVLDKITRLLKNGGILVIMIPTIECKLQQKLDRKNIHWHMFLPPEHLSFYSKIFLDNYMAKHKFTLEKRYYTAGGLNGRYSKRSENYRLLKNTTYELLNKYYTISNIKKNRGILDKIIDLLKYSKRFIVDEYLPINKYPYYDHMYTYYKKF